MKVIMFASMVSRYIVVNGLRLEMVKGYIHLYVSGLILESFLIYWCCNQTVLHRH